ncbi:MAG TPA: ImmA/IrrE family metallo-endopeptidase [Anaerolineae bacterium]|nr:ImmA/IrrE family metallo-endopeptidase [Anaerolineae bacterium]
MIFLDGSDPANEQRITVAHEIAHFLVDYQMPRARAT